MRKGSGRNGLLMERRSSRRRVFPSPPRTLPWAGDSSHSSLLTPRRDPCQSTDKAPLGSGRSSDTLFLEDRHLGDPGPIRPILGLAIAFRAACEIGRWVFLGAGRL